VAATVQKLFERHRRGITGVRNPSLVVDNLELGVASNSVGFALESGNLGRKAGGHPDIIVIEYHYQLTVGTRQSDVSGYRHPSPILADDDRGMVKFFHLGGNVTCPG
jgi:hypothetical protein